MSRSSYILFNRSSNNVKDWMVILDPGKARDLAILNMIILSLILTGVSNVCILLASKYSDLRTDRSAGQIFKAIEKEHFDFVLTDQEDFEEQLEQAIKKKQSGINFLPKLSFKVS